MLTFDEKKHYLLNALFRSNRLTSSEKIVALAMAFKINPDGSSNLTLREIGELSSLTKVTVKVCIGRLEEKIGLDVLRTPKKNYYRFTQWSGI